jgi:hypothetical protein
MKINIKLGDKYKGNDGVIVQIIFLDIILNKIKLNALNLFECGFTEYNTKCSVLDFQKWVNENNFIKQ